MLLSKKENFCLKIFFPRLVLKSSTQTGMREGSGIRRMSVKCEVRGGPTDASVRFRRTWGKLEHISSLVPQAPAVQDLAVALLKVIKLQHVGRVQKPADRKWPQCTWLVRIKSTGQRGRGLLFTFCSCRADLALAPAARQEPDDGGGRRGTAPPRGCRAPTLCLQATATTSINSKCFHKALLIPKTKCDTKSNEKKKSETEMTESVDLNSAGSQKSVSLWSLTCVPGVCRGWIRGTGAGARSCRAETGLRQQHTQDEITSCVWPPQDKPTSGVSWFSATQRQEKAFL